MNNQASPYIQPNIGGVISKISGYARKRMFASLMRIAQPTAATTVLDVGVTSDRREDSNFFEKLYPYPHSLTAVGLEDAFFLEQECPGLRYIKADGLQLPFPDQSFDLVVSFAVLEHVGSRKNQKAFIEELCRVGRTCFITTPNRWYPIEFHTVLPIIHWLPPSWFRTILRFLGKGFWAKEENLNLLSSKELLALIPSDVSVQKSHHKLLGIVSNLFFILRRLKSHGQK
jgi:SAM-dependent methyltransferase